MALSDDIRARFWPIREVAKRLGVSEKVVRRYVREGKLTARIIEGRRYFARDATEHAIVRILSEEKRQGERLSLEEREERAIELLRAGHVDGAVVSSCKLSLDHVERLRRSLGPAVARATATDDRTSWERARAAKRAEYRKALA